MSKGRLTQLFLALLITLVCVSPVLAGQEHEPRWGDFAWRVINLILFCGILWYFVGGLCKKYFRNRRQNIQDTLNELEQRREDAKSKLKEIETRIANLEAERRAILDESRAQAEKLKNGIVGDARRQASQIVEQARRTAENEGRAMIDRIRATVADEIVDAASRALSGRLTDKEHDRLIANSLEKVTL